jgi:hypothetical protein
MRNDSFNGYLQSKAFEAMLIHNRTVEQRSARRAHIPEVAGSNPVGATSIILTIAVAIFMTWLLFGCAAANKHHGETLFIIFKINQHDKRKF